ncbi:MAG: cell division protein ZapB [Candidatus Electrothrix sp. GW3-4]|uniref:cell division protein ZapB n=1 Tax=Candidatus Electrothrix sp. GW3-4 TaxID=3126740 RepID=UPI0030D24C34
MDNEEFVRLEQLVDTLIDNYSSLQKKYCVLEEKLHESEEERELLKMELAELQEQRSEVGRRVSGLLGRIEQWESEQGFGEQAENEQRGEENNELSDSAPPLNY